MSAEDFRDEFERIEDEASAMAVRLIAGTAIATTLIWGAALLIYLPEFIKGM